MAKLYHEEAGTEELTTLIERENPVIAVSDIAAIEMVPAFAKKVRRPENLRFAAIGVGPGFFGKVET